MTWRLRHITTEHNPADKPSRLFDPVSSTPKPPSSATPLCGHIATSSFEQGGVPAGGGSWDGERGGARRELGRTSQSLAWELFSGSGNLTAALEKQGAPCLVPIDVQQCRHHDLSHPAVQRVILDVISRGILWYLHLGTPCTVWSRARHNIRNHKKARAKERLGLQLAAFSARIAWLCLDLGIGFSIENPRGSLLWSFGPMQQLLRDSRVFFVIYDSCCYKAGCKKPTAILTNNRSLCELSRRCDGQHRHEPLTGTWKVKIDGRWVTENRTSTAGAYTPCLARAWGRALLQSKPFGGSERPDQVEILRQDVEHQLEDAFERPRAGEHWNHHRVRCRRPPLIRRCFWANSAADAKRIIGREFKAYYPVETTASACQEQG